MAPAFLATFLSGLTGGKVAVDVFKFILDLIPHVTDLVQQLRELKKDEDGDKIPGAEKAEAIVKSVASMIDEEFDELPAWKNLSEERRDRMLYGLVEWVYWGIELEGTHGKRGKRKLFGRALTQLKGAKKRRGRR
jgi:hypothetical protein